jgi:hypothetical protein
MSISPDTLLDFYKSPVSKLAGVPVSDFESELDKFCRFNGCNKEKFSMVCDLAGRKDWSISDVMVSNDSLLFPEDYISKYIQQDSIDQHANMLSECERDGILNELVESGETWDFVWFDSGEVSSIVEWEIINSNIRSGGLVAFHDIFSPKSMKNFVVAANILNNPDWDVLCVDSRTVQGLMIAKKTV